jgi:hypothetical protein
MTNAEILDNLGYNLDDPGEERYTSAIKLAAMKSVLSTLAAKAHVSLLRPLQSESNLTIPVTGYALPSDYFRYLNSSLYLLYPIKWVTRIEVDKLGIMDNQFSKGSDADPLCYVWGTKIYLDVTTYSGNYNKLKLYYIKTPTAPADNSNEPAIHAALHEPYQMLAEAQLRATYKYGTAEDIALLRKNANDLFAEANRRAATGDILP